MKPGIYSLTDMEYHADPSDRPSLSASIAKILVSETPLHAWAAHPKLNPNFVREEKDIFDRGTVAHALLLQGIEIAEVLDFPDWRKGDAQRARDNARAAGKVPILEKHWTSIQCMVARAREQLALHREAKNAFTAGKPEVTIVWEDDHGVICRARLDWLHDSYLLIDDYKSTGREANPSAIMGKVVDDWDIQEAFYRRGVQKLTGKEPQFRFIAQENTEPYALSVIGFGPEIHWMGEKKVQYAIDLWAKCVDSGQWPGYPDRICYPELPRWAEEQWLRKETA